MSGVRAWEIPLWNCGARIRRKSWAPYDYIVREHNGVWNNGTASIMWPDVCTAFMNEDDWEPYVEPKAKRKVTFYRPVYKRDDGTFFTSCAWFSKKESCDSLSVVGWETREIEVEI